MAYANGRIPASALAPIAGGRLRKDAAARWNAMAYDIRRRTGVTVLPNGPYSSYRDYAGQVLMRAQWCGRGNCGNAAIPGTSNHGLGIAVDVNRPDLVNAYGAPYGYQKRWSDAAWENWHMKWAGFGKAAEAGPRVIEKGSAPGDDVQRLQVYLRAAGYLRPDWKVHRKYTLKVRKAVRAFQRAHGMPVDGIVGPKTLAALKRAAQ
jgi:hypothetical protein